MAAQFGDYRAVSPGVGHNRHMRAIYTSKFILLASAATAVIAVGSVTTDVQCHEILQRALEAKNPETRVQAVVA